MLLSSALATKPRLRGRSLSAGELAALTLGLTALVLPAATYTGAHVTRNLAHLSELLEQSRFGEAQMLARRLLAFDPGAKLDRRPLSDVAREIEQVVLELEARTAAPLASSPGESERLERARELAMLGRTDAALDLLRDAPAWNRAAEACNLSGLIQETTGQWMLGRECYERATSACEPMADSPERPLGWSRRCTASPIANESWGITPPRSQRTSSHWRSRRRPTRTSCWRSLRTRSSRPRPASTRGGRCCWPPAVSRSRVKS
jgi:hypothetical protein